MPRVYVSIGSNIEREKNIPAGLAALEKKFGSLVISSIYEAETVGFIGAPFYNLVVSFETELAVKSLTTVLRTIELAQGRSQNAQKFSARSLDLDLLLYGDAIIDEENLQIPRADIEQYAFVLEPLTEIAPDLLHPVNGKTCTALWQVFDKHQIRQQRVDVSFRV
jgi:2-amino-4-hydroxy-6-hydroxymethyldihydropteridine diphosphokinase